MSAPTPAEPPSDPARIARMWLGPTFVVLSVCVMIQTFLAVLAVFGHARFWAHHMSFVHWFDWLSVVAVVLSILGHHSWRVKRLALATIGLILCLYVSAGVDLATNARYAAAVHPVLALLLFWVSANGARRAHAERRPGSSKAPAAS